MKVDLSPVFVGILLALAQPALATDADVAASVPATAHGPQRRAHAWGTMLRDLNLSADQRTRVKAIHDDFKPRFASLRGEGRKHRDALARTAPTDPAYAALVERSKADAAEWIQLRSDAWSQIYALLTAEQRAGIPALLTARREQWRERTSDWTPAVDGPL